MGCQKTEESSLTGAFGYTFSLLYATTDHFEVSTPMGRRLSKVLVMPPCKRTLWPRSACSFRYPSPSVLAGYPTHCEYRDGHSSRWTLTSHSNRRGETVITGLSLHMFGYILNSAFTGLNNRGVKFFGVVWTQTFANLPHPLNIAWLSLACRNSEERSLSMAM